MMMTNVSNLTIAVLLVRERSTFRTADVEEEAQSLPVIEASTGLLCSVLGEIRQAETRTQRRPKQLESDVQRG